MPGATCLCSALALQRLLSSAGHPSQVHIGVARDATGFMAHAWLVHDGVVVIGEEEHERYTRLTAWDARETLRHVGLVFAALLSIGRRADRRAAACHRHRKSSAGRDARPSSPGREALSSSLDGRYWIVGRFRLDARDELRARLGAAAATASDAMLCLLAYAKWSEGFTEFLAGDFAFALWDDERQCLLGVRDQPGRAHALPFEDRRAPGSSAMSLGLGRRHGCPRATRSTTTGSPTS